MYSLVVVELLRSYLLAEPLPSNGSTVHNNNHNNKNNNNSLPIGLQDILACFMFESISSAYLLIHAGFLLGVFLSLKDGGGISLRNVGFQLDGVIYQKTELFKVAPLNVPCRGHARGS
jgi:hypothetical protein